MTVKILVCWERDDEIKRAQKIKNWIEDLLDAYNLHAGTHTVNMPPKSFGIIVPEGESKNEG